jgi:hypothetical protein
VLSAGQIGRVVLTRDEGQPVPQFTLFDLPADVLPEPTIMATIDFVMDEARYFQKVKERQAKLN